MQTFEKHGNRIIFVDEIEGVGRDDLYEGEFICEFHDIYETDHPLWNGKERRLAEGCDVEEVSMKVGGEFPLVLVVFEKKPEHMHGEGWGVCSCCKKAAPRRNGAICGECWEGMEHANDPDGSSAHYPELDDDDDIPF
jgi:hypothetical protein